MFVATIFSVSGRKSACQVQIDKSGFSLQHIRICEGQVVTFSWEEHEGQGFNVTQVCVCMNNIVKKINIDTKWNFE